MATVGRKPKPGSVKRLQGNPGKRSLKGAELTFRETVLAPPLELSEAEQTLWSRYIDSAWWLQEHDGPKAYLWVCLQLQFQAAPDNMGAARIANLRAVGSELGLDPSARMRIGGQPTQDDPADEFFDWSASPQRGKAN